MSHPRILSIDDSKAVHAFLTSLLTGHACTLEHAFDGEQGFGILTAQKDPYDAILLDWEMPKLTGIETLKKIRAHGIQTPVIMVTTKNTPQEITQALELGANEYVMKPFDKGILMEKLASVMGRRIE